MWGRLRVGFVTGPQPLVNKVQMHMMVSVLHTPMLSQVILLFHIQHWCAV